MTNLDMGIWNVYGGKMDGVLHQALAEHLFDRAQKGEHTLLFPEYHTPCLVLSRDQHINDYLGNGHIEYTRAITPGAAMLCDKNVLSFVITVPKTINGELYLSDPVRTHQHFGGKILKVLQDFGVKNLILGEQFYIKIKGAQRNLPIVGTAQRREKNAYLYQGIITLDRWDAEYLRSILKLRKKGTVNEYDLIRDLPYVSSDSDRPLDERRQELCAALAEAITGTREIKPVPQDMLAEAQSLAAIVYRNDRWRRSGQHPLRNNISLQTLKEGRGFCLLGSEFA